MPNFINLPALRGCMGDWIYYVALLPFNEVNTRIKKTDEVHKSEFLRDMLQRSLENRMKDIASYLRQHEQRFFNSVVIGVYDGEPTWHSIKVNSSYPGEFDVDQRTRESIGVLTLSGNEKLFAIDGQHRVAGIKEFISSIPKKEKDDLVDELCCIFVAHSLSDSGNKRTRRLFSTLNRYAKPVSLTEIIALNEDDIVAIACRSMLENHPLFYQKGRVSLKKTKSLGPNDRKAFTSLISLYQFVDIFLRTGKPKAWIAFKNKRPDDSVVKSACEKTLAVWDELVRNIPELQRIVGLCPTDSIPTKFRGTHGGDLLFRPIALPIIAQCLKQSEQWGMPQGEFIKRFAAVPRELADKPWRDVIWRDGMMVKSDNQSLVRDLILWMINSDEREDHIVEGLLKERYSKVTKVDVLKAELPKKLF